MAICQFWISIIKDNENNKLAIDFKKCCQERFIGPWVQRENYSWPEGRKQFDHVGLSVFI
jgi:hypothetical protein